MKYIRTRETVGERLEPSEDCPIVEDEHWLLLTKGIVDKVTNPIIASSDNLGELCDECVIVKGDKYHSILKHVRGLGDDNRTGKVEFKLDESVIDIRTGWIDSLKTYIENGYTVRGAIWTDKGIGLSCGGGRRKMNEQKITALDALGIIKEIELAHMEQDVDYDYEENIEYSYYEAHDGTIEENFPDEIEKIEKVLNAFEVIKDMYKHQADISKILNDIEESDDYQDFSFNYSNFPEKDYKALKGILE